MSVMVPHYCYDLGFINIGGWSATAVVQVKIELNYAANVMLMDIYNYNTYCEGGYYTYYGGHATSSPVILNVPTSGLWKVVVDNGGADMGGIQAYVSTNTINTF